MDKNKQGNLALRDLVTNQELVPFVTSPVAVFKTVCTHFTPGVTNVAPAGNI